MSIDKSSRQFDIEKIIDAIVKLEDKDSIKKVIENLGSTSMLKSCLKNFGIEVDITNEEALKVEEINIIIVSAQAKIIEMLEITSSKEPEKQIMSLDDYYESKEYKKRIKHRTFDKSVKSKIQGTFESDIYVPQRLLIQNQSSDEKEEYEIDQTETSLEELAFNELDDYNEEQKIIHIQGVSGIGKTTLFKAFLSNPENIKKFKEKSITAVFIDANDLVDKVKERTKEVFNQNESMDSEGYITLGMCPNDFMEEHSDISNFLDLPNIKQNKIYLFIDGLEEAKENHNDIETFLELFCKTHNCKIFINSRFGTSIAFQKTQPVEIDGLKDIKEIEKYIKNYMRGAEENKIITLIDKIKNNESLKNMSHTPAMLANICILAKNISIDEISKMTLGKIYEESIRYIIIGHEGKKDAPDSERQYLIKHINIFYELAFDMQKIGEKSISIEELDIRINRYAKRNNEDAKKLKKMVLESNMIMPKRNNQYDFLHQSFKNYFTAKKLEKLDEEKIQKFTRIRSKYDKYFDKESEVDFNYEYGKGELEIFKLRATNPDIFYSDSFKEILKFYIETIKDTNKLNRFINRIGYTTKNCLKEDAFTSLIDDSTDEYGDFDIDQNGAILATELMNSNRLSNSKTGAKVKEKIISYLTGDFGDNQWEDENYKLLYPNLDDREPVHDTFISKLIQVCNFDNFTNTEINSLLGIFRKYFQNYSNYKMDFNNSSFARLALLLTKDEKNDNNKLNIIINGFKIAQSDFWPKFEEIYKKQIINLDPHFQIKTLRAVLPYCREKILPLIRELYLNPNIVSIDRKTKKVFDEITKKHINNEKFLESIGIESINNDFEEVLLNQIILKDNNERLSSDNTSKSKTSLKFNSKKFNDKKNRFIKEKKISTAISFINKKDWSSLLELIRKTAYSDVQEILLKIILKLTGEKAWPLIEETIKNTIDPEAKKGLLKIAVKLTDEKSWPIIERIIKEEKIYNNDLMRIALKIVGEKAWPLIEEMIEEEKIYNNKLIRLALRIVGEKAWPLIEEMIEEIISKKLTQDTYILLPSHESLIKKVIEECGEKAYKYASHLSDYNRLLIIENHSPSWNEMNTGDHVFIEKLAKSKNFNEALLIIKIIAKTNWSLAEEVMRKFEGDELYELLEQSLKSAGHKALLLTEKCINTDKTISKNKILSASIKYIKNIEWEWIENQISKIGINNVAHSTAISIFIKFERRAWKFVQDWYKYNNCDESFLDYIIQESNYMNDFKLNDFVPLIEEKKPDREYNYKSLSLDILEIHQDDKLQAWSYWQKLLLKKDGNPNCLYREIIFGIRVFGEAALMEIEKIIKKLNISTIARIMEEIPSKYMLFFLDYKYQEWIKTNNFNFTKEDFLSKWREIKKIYKEKIKNAKTKEEKNSLETEMNKVYFDYYNKAKEIVSILIGEDNQSGTLTELKSYVEINLKIRELKKLVVEFSGFLKKFESSAELWLGRQLNDPQFNQEIKEKLGLSSDKDLSIKNLKDYITNHKEALILDSEPNGSAEQDQKERIKIQDIFGMNFEAPYVISMGTLAQFGQENGYIGGIYSIKPKNNPDIILGACQCSPTKNLDEIFILRTSVHPLCQNLGLVIELYGKMLEKLKSEGKEIKTLISTVPIFEKNSFLNFSKIRAKVINTQLRNMDDKTGLRVDKFRIHRSADNIAKLYKGKKLPREIDFENYSGTRINLNNIIVELPILDKHATAIKEDITNKKQDPDPQTIDFRNKLLKNTEITSLSNKNNFIYEVPYDPNWEEDLDQARKIQVANAILLHRFLGQGFQMNDCASGTNQNPHQEATKICYYFYKPETVS